MLSAEMQYQYGSMSFENRFWTFLMFGLVVSILLTKEIFSEHLKQVGNIKFLSFN